VEGVNKTRVYLQFLIKALNVTIPEEVETHYEAPAEEGIDDEEAI